MRACSASSSAFKPDLRRAEDLVLHCRWGSILFPGRLPVKDYTQYSLEADEDENVPLPPAPKDGNVSGKPREFLNYAPSWAKHPDYDRV